MFEEAESVELAKELNDVVRDPQHGLYPDTMALNTSDCDAMRSPSIKWPYSPRIVRPAGVQGPPAQGSTPAALSHCIIAAKASQ